MPPQKKSRLFAVEFRTRIAELVGGRSPDWASRPRILIILKAHFLVVQKESQLLILKYFWKMPRRGPLTFSLLNVLMHPTKVFFKSEGILDSPTVKQHIKFTFLC